MKLVVLIALIVAVASGTPSTVAPGPAETFSLTAKNGSICILLDFSAHFKISYKNLANERVNAHLNIVNATVDERNSFCDNNKTDGQKITLQWGKNSLSFQFNRYGKKEVMPSKIVLKYHVDNNTFPDHSEPDEEVSVYAAKVSTLSVSNLRSYQCKSKKTIKMSDNVHMSIRNAKIQAYRGDHKDKKFSFGEICELDFHAKNTVPIVVLCVFGLAVMAIGLFVFARGKLRKKNNTNL